MFAILVRNGKFLDNRYQWGLLPDLIPEWHFPAVMNVMMSERNPEKPTGFAIVNGKECIDLDNLEIIKIQEAHVRHPNKKPTRSHDIQRARTAIRNRMELPPIRGSKHRIHRGVANVQRSG